MFKPHNLCLNCINRSLKYNFRNSNNKNKNNKDIYSRYIIPVSADRTILW